MDPFGTNPVGRFQIFRVPPNGTGFSRVTTLDGDADYPSLSEDGSTIVFQATEMAGFCGDTFQLFSVNGDGDGVGGGSDVCLDNGNTVGFYDDFTTPAPGAGLWYLVRGDNACGLGDYGPGRSATACP